MIGGCRSCAWWVLKIAYSALFIGIGLDKFFNILTQWQKYISPMVHANIPIQAANLVLGLGALEVAIGLIMLLVATRLAAFGGSIWLLLIAANLASMGYPYDVAIYYVVLALGLFGLVLLAPDAECATCSCNKKGKK